VYSKPSTARWRRSCAYATRGGAKLSH